MDDNHVSGSTLEEGRNALNELERYLKEKNLNQFPEIGNGKQQMEDRKLLDHKPRGERLKHIKGSPLGLTLEELDDRGLIDGGGSLPSHSSSIQRGRRQLEMRQRSSRMRDRASGYPKPLQSFFHMIRLLSKRGLNVEEYCRHRDPDNRGIMGKRQFASMLRKLSLPFGTRELNDVKNRYTIINTDQVDYEAMLRDAGVLDNTDVGGEIEGESMDGQGTNIGLFSSIIYELKNMLTDSMESLGKTPEDVYHMFAQWDPEGTGTVTSTQFLRVLTRMHVVLNDNDQDFIVELLDLDHMGKVYYDGILNYCFGDNYTRDGSTSSVSYSISSPQHQHRKGASGGGDDNTNNETLSNISQGSGVLIDIGGGVVIPGGHEQGESNYSSHNNLHSVGASRRPHTASRVPAEIIAFDNLSPLRGEGELSRSMVFQDKPTLDPASASFAPNRIQRPLTAAARVSSNYKQNYPVGQGQQHANARAAHSRGRPESAKQYVVEVSDDNDVINDDDYDAKNQINYADQLPRAGSDGQQYYHRNVSFLGALSSQDPNFQSADAICRQYLQSLRQVIINRTRGNPLNEGYLHDVFNQLFDQEGTLFFQQRGLVAAVRELLNADLQPPVADAAIKHLAIDSGDRVTFSEFAVFVMDPNMSSLEDKLQQHCASQFLVLGRDFQSYLFGSLWSDSAKQGELGQVSTRKFVECLNKLGNGEFSQDDIIRLVLRFDVHGSGHCDIARFLRVITKGQQWKQAEKMVAYQEDAAEEAETIRKNIQMGQQYSFMGSNSAACEDFISMAEYLGIKLLSERHLHWIVHEALSAPLPENWVNQTSNNGDTYYFNALTNKSQYAHPLDSYFFNLIEEYRNKYVTCGL